MDQVRLLVADGDDLFREGMSKVVGRDPTIRVVARARTAAEGLEKAREFRPDLVLMELHMPDMEGIAAARSLARDVPDARVALITKRFTAHELVEGVKVGVRGYITKDVEIDTLIDAIKKVASGQFFLPPEASMLLLEELAAVSNGGFTPTERAPTERVNVTEREREVLALLVHGATNRDIAKKLHITENTVKVHLRKILEKLHLRNRQQAVAFAISTGLVRLEGNGPSVLQQRRFPESSPSRTPLRRREGMP